MCFKNAAIWLTPFHRPYGNYRNGQPHICTHCTIISRDRWFPFHLAFLRWLLGQLKQQLINTEHPVLPRELGCQSLWLVSCASGSFYTQPQNSLLLYVVGTSLLGKKISTINKNGVITISSGLVQLRTECIIPWKIWLYKCCICIFKYQVSGKYIRGWVFFFR